MTQSRTSFGGMYHVREPALQRLHMSVPDAVQVLSSWTERKAYVQVLMHMDLQKTPRHM